MSEPSAGAVPERICYSKERLSGRLQQAFSGLARRELRHLLSDLSELEMNSTSRVETLTRFLRKAARVASTSAS